MIDVTISACDFHDLGFYGSTYPLGGTSLQGGALSCIGADGVTISNCTFTRMRDALYFDNHGTPSYIANLTYVSNTMSFIQEWGLTLITSTNTYLSNITVCGNLFTNTDQGFDSWGGYGGSPHRDTIFSFGAEGCSGNCALMRYVYDTNVFVYNNVFVDTSNQPGGTAVIWFQDGASVEIYNNIFNNTQQANAAVQLTGPPTNSVWRTGVYNNSFYLYDYETLLTVGSSPANSFLWTVDPSDHSLMVDVRNNIIYAFSVGTPYGNSFDLQVESGQPQLTNNVRFDYNLYRTGDFYGGQMIYGLWDFYSPYGYISISSAETYLGWDTDSITGDPLCVNTNDFHLQSGSPCIGVGTNLSALGYPGLNSDFDGNPRPSTGAWTLGAFEPLSSPAPDVLWWKLNEGSGTTTADATGNGWTGSLIRGPTWTTGENGTGALLFNTANSQFVQTSSQLTTVAGNTSLTLTGWVNRSGTGSSGTFMFGTNPYNCSFVQEVLCDGNDGLYFVMENGSSTYGEISSYTSTGWHFFALVFDGSQTGNSARLKAYIDGSAQTLSFTGTIPSSLPSSGDMGFFELANDSCGNGQLNSTLDDIRIYDAALTSVQIAALYNDGAK